METLYNNTRENLKTWFKSSALHLKAIKQSFKEETALLVKEARKEYEKSKKQTSK